MTTGMAASIVLWPEIEVPVILPINYSTGNIIMSKLLVIFYQKFCSIFWAFEAQN